MEGDGMLNDLKVGFMKKLRSKSTSLTDFITKNGALKIINVEICRTPVEKKWQDTIKLLNRKGMKDFTKKYKYDTFFHLYAILIFDNGERYLI
jgi:hypothetical protein